MFGKLAGRDAQALPFFGDGSLQFIFVSRMGTRVNGLFYHDARRTLTV